MTTAALARGSIWVTCNRFVRAALAPYPDLDDPGNRTDLFRLDAATGATCWRRRVHGITLGAVTEAGGGGVVPNTGGRLRAWAAASGRLPWSARPGGPLAGGVTVADGYLLAATASSRDRPSRRKPRVAWWPAPPLGSPPRSSPARGRSLPRRPMRSCCPTTGLG